MVEPPVLMSRILMFVLATSIVVLGALAFTLFKMIPLERPEIFFVQTPTRFVNTVIEPLDTNQDNKTAMEYYERGFIRTYIIARNTLYPNVAMTRNNWAKIVKPWSSDNVFSAFTDTALYKDYTFNNRPSVLSCSVSFSDTKREPAIVRTKNNEYIVNFTWVCENNNGQTTQKNYKIRIKVQSDLDNKLSGTLDNLEKLKQHPLGIQVTEYKVQGNKDDPLNSDRTSW